MRIKKGDKVQVITGAYKGTIGEVKQAFPREDKVIVEGVNIVKKHQKPTQQNPDGGIIEKKQRSTCRMSCCMMKKRKRLAVFAMSSGQTRTERKKKYACS